MSRILITGINGFVGHHVSQIVHSIGHQILGVGNQPTASDELREIIDQYVSCDLTSSEGVRSINLSDIDAIINLAGLANVGDSRGKSELYNSVNVGVHTVLYEECMRQNAHPRIIAVSTGAVYDPEQKLPLTEISALVASDNTNEYVISKQLMEKSLEAFRQKGLRIIVARPFNHSGPGQLPGFLVPDLAEQILQAKSSDNILRVGNLKTKRDYTDVRDVADAYVQLATVPDDQIKHDLYNICSGTSTAGEVVLETLLNAFDAVTVDVIIDPTKLRKHDVMEIYGSHSRLTEATGWKPKYELPQMLRDFADWRLKRA